MREQYNQIMKALFCRKVLQTRTDLGLTQEEMASRLDMATRSYVYLEHGENCCNVVTYELFLSRVCKNPTEFREEVRHAFEAVKANV